MFHALLSSKKLLLDQLSEQIPVLEPVSQVSDHTVLRIGDAKMARGVTIQHLKWRTTQGRVEGSVVLIFCQRKPLTPLFGAGVHRTPEKCL